MEDNAMRTMEERAKIEQEICNLRSVLQSDVSDIGDWKVIRCQEYAMAGKEAPYDIVELSNARDVIRDQIEDLKRALDPRAAPGYRLVYRHDTLPGSVIEYNELGVLKRLFVADAKFRGLAQWKVRNTAVSGMTQWPHMYAPTCTSNLIDDDEGHAILKDVADLMPYSAQLSDTHFKAALTETLKPVLMTAKDATDMMIADGECPAADFVRSRTSSVGTEMQLPNIYQLLVMFASGDAIDALDPTVADNASFALGKYGTNANRWTLGGVSLGALSSTEGNDTCACIVHRNGIMQVNNKIGTDGVIPVAELD